MACCFPFFGRHRRRVGVTTGPSPYVLLILGIDGAGKSSLLMRMKGDDTTKTFTTWGFSTENIIWQHVPVDPNRMNTTNKSEMETKKIKNRVEIRLYDVGGGQKIRGIWSNYFAECHGIIYVINAADTPERLVETTAELDKLRHDERLQGKPILILLNKYESRDACSLVKMCMTYSIIPPSTLSNESKQSFLDSKSQNRTSLGDKEKNISSLPVNETTYLHSNLLRIQASCCIVSPTAIPSKWSTPSSSPLTQTAGSTSSTNDGSVSSPTLTTSPSMKLDGASTLADGINWLISAIQLRWETSDMRSRIDFFKLQQHKIYEEEREKQRKRVEDWKREKERKDSNALPAMQSRSWSTSNMPAGVWGGIAADGRSRRETSPIENESPSSRPLLAPPPLPLLYSPASPNMASDQPSSLNTLRTKTLAPLLRPNKTLPPITLV